MPNYRGKASKITWGAAFANTLSLGDGLDTVVTYPVSRDGSETIQYRSGIEDAWDAGDDEVLEGQARYIPLADGTTPQGKAATGWNGATGFAAFLKWARRKNVFRFYPDYGGAPTTFFPCYLVEPMDAIELEDDYTRNVKLKIRTSDGSVWDGY